MEEEMVSIPRKVYEELLEEVGIVRNKKIMEAVEDSDNAKKKGVKTWKLNY